jgi:hypothetical protein
MKIDFFDKEIGRDYEVAISRLPDYRSIVTDSGDYTWRSFSRSGLLAELANEIEFVHGM